MCASRRKLLLPNQNRWAILGSVATLRLLCLLGLITIIFCDFSYAQTSVLVGKKVERIAFDPPNSRQPLLQSDLDSLVDCKVGAELTELCVRTSIENLFASGRYEDIVAKADLGSAPDLTVLTFVTTGAMFVGRVTVSGVPTPPSEAQLLNETKLQLGQQFTNLSLSQAMDNLQNLLRSNGFFKADIAVIQDANEITENVDLAFAVKAGKRARISSPQFVGDLQASPKSLLKATHWQRPLILSGFREATDQRVQRGVDRIRSFYRKKDYLMAKVALTSLQFDEQENTVTPILNVDAGPIVRVRTSGMKMSKGKLRNLIPVFQEQAVDRDLLQEGRRNLQTFLESQGYFDAKIDFSIEQSKPKEQVITYQIERGTKFRLAEFKITGNRYFDLPTLQEQMNIQPATLLRYRNGRFSENLLARDVAAIKNLYRSNGFPDADIKTRVERKYKGKSDQVGVFVTISEGAQATVGKLELNGAGTEDDSFFRERMQLIEDQPFSEAALDADLDLMLSRYYSKGFVNAEVIPDVKENAAAHTYDIVFRIKAGQQQFVRRVLNSGLDTTNLDLFYQRVPIETGDPLSLSELSDAQRRLYDLGIFARVDVAVQNSDGQESLKNVIYRVEEARRYPITAGFGLEAGNFGGASGSLSSAGGDFQFSPRITLGISRLNFLGIGHTVSLQTRWSRLQERAVLTYVAPQFIGRDDLSLSFSAIGDRSRGIRTFESDRLEGTLQVNQKYSRALTLQYRFTYRQVGLRDVKVTPAFIPLLAQPVRSSLVGFGILQDRRDDPIDSTSGMFNSVDLGFASKALGSRVPFMRGLIRNTTYHRLAKDIILARTFTFGVINATASQSDNTDQPIPLAERFFSGGASAHRGFGENQAGPRDLLTGFAIGGNALLINGLELRFPLLGDNLRGVLFHDAGNVYSDLSGISLRLKQKGLADFDYMVHSVGLGFRYRTPAGPVRLDFGYSLNPPRFRGCQGSLQQLQDPNGPCNPSSPIANFVTQRLGGFQFHFSLGQTF
jgi:outer membrane protein insertion porin family